MKITIEAIDGIPLIEEGDDIAGLIAEHSDKQGVEVSPNDIIVIAQKIVSKAEGRQVDLVEILPSPRAVKLAKETNKDPRLVELILQESDEIIRHRKDVLIVASKLGLVHANAGIDQSNISGQDTALLLPLDPDTTADAIRISLEAQLCSPLGVIIADSTGRAWRKGTVGIAIGVSGLEALQNQRGRPDLYKRPLEITEVGHADQLAAAASIAMGQADEGQPVALIRGLKLEGDAGIAGDLIRDKSEDLFR